MTALQVLKGKSALHGAVGYWVGQPCLCALLCEYSRQEVSDALGSTSLCAYYVPNVP